MPRVNIAAYTKMDRQGPGFVSINMVDDGVEIIVRSDPKPGEYTGACAQVTIPVEAWNAILRRASGL